MSIVVTNITGNFKEDADIIGKMDPYLLVTVGNETKKTTVRQGAGKTPVWPDILTFADKGGVLKITAMDEDVGADDNLGTGTFDISPAYNYPNKPGTFDVQIFNKGQLAGSVHVTVTFRV